MRWWLRVLLAAYPKRFRERYRREILEACAADRRRPEHASPVGAVRFWLRTSTDLVASAVRARWHETAQRPAQPGRSTMERIVQDIRHAWKQLLRRPGFTAVAVLSLAFGIGGSAIIIAFVDGFVLRPFAYPDPDRLVTVGVTFPKLSNEERFIEAISPPEFLDIRNARSIESIAAFDAGNRNISGGDRPERVLTGLAATDPFGPFGLRPALGRGFTVEELVPNGPSVAIVSDRLWKGRLGGDPGIIGRIVRVNGTPTTVVGVMPPELLVLGIDLWIPWGVDLPTVPRTRRQMTLIGRLAPGATLEDANAELAMMASQTQAAFGGEIEEYQGWRLSATPWVEALMRDIRPWARLLLGAVGLVLLIACVNLSNLMLARSTTRQQEMAVRLALGAGRLGIARHLIAEVALLVVAGAGAGLLLAQVGLPAIVSLVPPSLNTLGVTAAVNGRVVAWAAILTIGSALLVALLPAIQSTRTDPQETLRTNGRGATSSRGTLSARQMLIVAEITLSVVLLAGAGLMLRSFEKLQRVEPGFDPADVLTMRLTLPIEEYRAEAINDFFSRLIERLGNTPGVRAVSAASQFPPQGFISMPFRLEGREGPGTSLPMALVTGASAGHFATLGVPLVSGRPFTTADRADAPAVIAVNEAFVSRYLPGGSPLGQRVRIGPADRLSAPKEIVAVVGNTQNRGLREPSAPEIFVPLHQQLNNQLYVLVRAAGDAASMLPAVRQQIAALDPEQPIYAVQTIDEAIAASTFGPRFSALLFAVFAAIALTLAVIGIHGVMSYAVSARTHEIGVRLAVGADRWTVRWLVLGQVFRMTAIGLALGLGGLLALSRVIRRSLFEIQPNDPLTIAGVVAVLGAVALVAGWLPAWRASRVDPVTALRYE